MLLSIFIVSSVSLGILFSSDAKKNKKTVFLNIGYNVNAMRL